MSEKNHDTRARNFAPGEHPDWEPPAATTGVFGWLRVNLFSSITSSILTLLSVAFIVWVVLGVFDWSITSATWSGTGGPDCAKNAGACWIFIEARFNQFMFFRYPVDEQWRTILVGIMLLVAGLPLLFQKAPHKKWFALFLLIPFPVISFILLQGGIFGLELVETNRWGGLMLTLVVAITGITASLPLGIVLALGRRSSMPIVRAVCIVFIEFWRGVPLITVLFMATVMIPLFLPEGVTFNQLLRALIGITLFASAYMAEVIRGGLQALPKGQAEAAAALGLNYPKSMRLIILPQALKIVIPGIVNTFIGLFKDTVLLLIIGLFDLLGAVTAAVRDNKWSAPSTPETGYVFAGVAFWLFCFFISRYSLSLEKRLHTGHKR